VLLLRPQVVMAPLHHQAVAMVLLQDGKSI
jgi:hypothetical protein